MVNNESENCLHCKYEDEFDCEHCVNCIHNAIDKFEPKFDNHLIGQVVFYENTCGLVLNVLNEDGKCNVLTEDGMVYFWDLSECEISIHTYDVSVIIDHLRGYGEDYRCEEIKF